MDCSLPGSSVHRILQAWILEWVAISFSRGSSWPRDQTQVSCIAGGFFTTGEVMLALIQHSSVETGALWLGFPRAKINISSAFSLTLSTHEKTQILSLFLGRGSPSLSWVAEILCPELVPFRTKHTDWRSLLVPTACAQPCSLTYVCLCGCAKGRKKWDSGSWETGVHWGPSARSWLQVNFVWPQNQTGSWLCSLPPQAQDSPCLYFSFLSVNDSAHLLEVI